MVEDSRAKLGQESDEDSDGENKRDLFEEALEHMRENKEYNIGNYLSSNHICLKSI